MIFSISGSKTSLKTPWRKTLQKQLIPQFENLISNSTSQNRPKPSRYQSSKHYYTDSTALFKPPTVGHLWNQTTVIPWSWGPFIQITSHINITWWGQVIKWLPQKLSPLSSRVCPICVSPPPCSSLAGGLFWGGLITAVVRYMWWQPVPHSPHSSPLRPLVLVRSLFLLSEHFPTHSLHDFS